LKFEALKLRLNFDHVGNPIWPDLFPQLPKPKVLLHWIPQRPAFSKMTYANSSALSPRFKTNNHMGMSLARSGFGGAFGGLTFGTVLDLFSVPRFCASSNTWFVHISVPAAH
jgi:hypothetical protein